MADRQIIECIHKLFESACLELFHSLDCNITRLGYIDFDPTEIPIACIDAGSDDLEVLLSLRLPFSVLAMTYPDQDNIAIIDDAKLEDWISELSNQLIGRVKTKMITHNCYLNIGLPNCYFGSDVDEYEHLLEGHEQAIFHFDVDNEIFESSISIEFFTENPSFALDATDDPNAAGESELELF